MSKKLVLAAGIVLTAIGGAMAQNASNTYRPEWYYQTGDGADWGPAIDRAQVALSALPNGGTLQLSCGKTYTVSSVSPNFHSLIRAFSNVDIAGCGHTSVLRMANGVYTSSAFFPRMIANTTTLNNVRFANFTIDMNGANNSCFNTCWAFNAAIEASAGNDIAVENVRFINNPGSNNTVFGTNANPATVTNLKLIGNIHEHNGDIVNSASIDWSGDFFIANNVTYSNIRHSDGPRYNGSAFELHGSGITASDIVVNDHFNCGIIANETASPVTNDINLGSFKCSNVKGGGIQIYSRAGATNTNVNVHDGVIKFLSGSSGIGIDASSVINAATGNNINLSVSNVSIYSDVTSNLGNNSSGISVGRWLSAKINNNQCYNTQGPCVRFVANASGAALEAQGNQIVNPGRTNNAALQAGVVVDATSGVTTDNISISGNPVTGAVRYSVINAQNSTAGAIFGNIASNVTVGQVSNSGGGVFVYSLPGGSLTFAGVDAGQTFTAFQQFTDNNFALKGSTSGTLILRAPAVAGSGVIRFPVGNTDFSAGGCIGCVVQQTSAGAALTVGLLSAASLSGLGSGVANALGINVGSAGAFVANGGALGSPSSAGTIPAFTLGGTISGGGNQINNVIIGSSNPLAGTHTTLQVNTSGNFGNPATPDARLTVNNNSGATTAPDFSADLHLIAADSSFGGIMADVFGSEVNFVGRASGGTRASKTAVGAGTIYMGIYGEAYNGTSYVYNAALEFITVNTQSGSDSSSKARLRTVRSGAVLKSDVMTWAAGVAIGDAAADPGVNALLIKPQLFSALTACSSTIRGAQAYVTDSSTSTWGATITGSGANNVLASCNGTNWTVAAK